MHDDSVFAERMPMPGYACLSAGRINGAWLWALLVSSACAEQGSYVRKAFFG
jgi:hypothetical protein